MNFLKILMSNLAKGPSTEAFPFGEASTPAGYHGRVTFDAKACLGCRLCEQVCAPGAIRFEKSAAGLSFRLWHNSCCYCSLCNFYCPVGAISNSEDWHLSHPQAEKYDLVEEGFIASAPCTTCGKPALAIGVNPGAIGFEPSADEMAQLRPLCPACRRKATAAMVAARQEAAPKDPAPPEAGNGDRS